MTKNYPEARKSPVKLSDEEKYLVYKFSIENHGLYQAESATEFRVAPDKIAKEMNLLKIIEGKQVNGHHVRTSVERVVAWQKRLGKLPVVPLETAELEQLKIHKKKSIMEIEEFKIEIEINKKEIELLRKENERLKKSDAQNKVDRIRAIVSC